MSGIEVGILGTGRMSVRLASELLSNGHDVVLGSRDVARAKRVAQLLNPDRVRPGSYAEAASSRFVIPAIFMRDGAFDLLSALRTRLAGATVIDILNPFNADYSDFILPWSKSASEELQRLLPQSTVVGAFKNVFWETFENPDFAEGHSDVYVISDDAVAKREVMALFAKSPFRLVDAGRLSNARTIERMTLLAAELGARHGFLPRVGWRFLGEPWKAGIKDKFAHVIA
jgi:predicted dinucleotide-binding enzyme